MGRDASRIKNGGWYGSLVDNGDLLAHEQACGIDEAVLYEVCIGAVLIEGQVQDVLALATDTRAFGFLALATPFAECPLKRCKAITLSSIDRSRLEM